MYGIIKIWDFIKNNEKNNMIIYNIGKNIVKNEISRIYCDRFALFAKK